MPSRRVPAIERLAEGLPEGDVDELYRFAEYLLKVGAAVDAGCTPTEAQVAVYPDHYVEGASK